MSHLTLNLLAAKGYQSEVLIKSFCWALSSVQCYHRGTLWKLGEKKQQKRITEPKDQREHASKLLVLEWHHRTVRPSTTTESELLCNASVFLPPLHKHQPREGANDLRGWPWTPEYRDLCQKCVITQGWNPQSRAEAPESNHKEFETQPFTGFVTLAK